MKKTTASVLKKATMTAVKGSANSATCGMFYQPKAPAALKKFSKVENDK